MATNPIQWFPGHMAKTKRMMRECLGLVDIVIELLDARIPYSSKNPDIDQLVGDKPRLTVLTKTSLADPEATRRWVEYYEGSGRSVLLIDSQSGQGLERLSDAVKSALSEKLARFSAKGMSGRALKAMIVGIPNVGKSSLINKLSGERRAKVENRPGVTVDKQWVTTNIGLLLLDMPGVLWPKFEDERVGENLAMTGAIRDAILDKEEIAMLLCGRLRERARDSFYQRYKLTDEADELDLYDLFELVGRKRGMLISGGEVNHERCANMLLEEFRSATIGRITLELPSDLGGKNAKL